MHNLSAKTKWYLLDSSNGFIIYFVWKLTYARIQRSSPLLPEIRQICVSHVEFGRVALLVVLVMASVTSLLCSPVIIMHRILFSFIYNHIQVQGKISFFTINPTSTFPFPYHPKHHWLFEKIIFWLVLCIIQPLEFTDEGPSPLINIFVMWDHC